MYIAIFSLLKISSVVKITCFFASMYCICNPLPHLTGFSSFLILVFFSTSERAHIFSYHLKDLLSFKNPFASSFFPSHTLFLGFLLSHTEWKLWKMRIFFKSSPRKVRPIFLILLCGFHILYFWHKRTFLFSHESVAAFLGPWHE